MDIIFPNNNPDSIILDIRITKIYPGLNIYKPMTEITFASPSFIPGMAKLKFTAISTYPKIIASAVNTPQYATFLLIKVLPRHRIKLLFTSRYLYNQFMRHTNYHLTRFRYLSLINTVFIRTVCCFSKYMLIFYDYNIHPIFIIYFYGFIF